MIIVNLNNTLGKESGTDATRMAEFTGWILANLRLGNPMVIAVDKHGVAKCGGPDESIVKGKS